MKKKSLIRRTALGLILFGVIVMTGVAVAAGIQMYNGSVDLYTSLAYSYVIPTASSINADAIEEIIDAGDDFVYYFKTGEVSPSSSIPESKLEALSTFWWDVLSYLKSIDILNDDIEYFYVVIPTDDDLIYLWDTDGDEDRFTYPLEHDEYAEGEKEYLMAAMYGSRYEYSLEIYKDGTDMYGTAFEAIRDENGHAVAVVAMDITMAGISGQFTAMMINMGIITAIILVAASIIYYLSIRKRMIIPLVTVKNAASGLVDDLENGSKRDIRIDVHTGDEIEEVARAFEEMEKQLKVYIRENEAAAAEKERIATEMDLASRIQLGMLPNTSTVFSGKKEITLSAGMKPAKAVGGDFYDFFFLDDTHLALVIADVSGKGVPAALFMMVAKILIRNYSKTGLSPKTVFEKVNASIVENNPNKIFVSVWLGILDLDTGILNAANAGHEYPVIRKADGSAELYKDKHSFVIGAMPNMKYIEYELTLLPGEGLFLYTDGVPEASTSGKEKLGTARMVETLQSASGSTPDQVLQTMEDAIRDFAKDAEQFDDITMMCFTYNGKEA